MQHIYITQNDHDRLADMVSRLERTSSRDQFNLKSLSQELARATILPSEDIPGDVITMRSQVCLHDLDSREEMTYTLCFPEEADAATNKISVLAPIGTALIGYKVGDTIEWEVPSGRRRLKVMKIVYQPEANGCMD